MQIQAPKKTQECGEPLASRRSLLPHSGASMNASQSVASEQKSRLCVCAENCGSTDGLLRCSRCRDAFFCSAACQRAHWPFHKDACRRNDFADAIEPSDAKFASWMRHHGKQAVLKDDEVKYAARLKCATASYHRRQRPTSNACSMDVARFFETRNLLWISCGSTWLSCGSTGRPHRAGGRSGLRNTEPRGCHWQHVWPSGPPANGCECDASYTRTHLIRLAAV